jgi:single-stranded-DNA-specific exonuclease
VRFEATWRLKRPDPGLVLALAKSLRIRPAVAACLINRGIVDPGLAASYIEPRLGDLDSPSGMSELDRAAERLARAVQNRERVGVFGDYDVDGVTSAAVISSFLRSLDIQVEAAIADRFQGYGIGADAVQRFIDIGCTLIIALDLGTSDREAADVARAAEVDLIIVDHHTIRDAFPEAFAFVNPAREDCGFPDKRLAAVGLAFYFAAATRAALSELGFVQKKDLDLRPLLDLVALGTVADVMPLVGNNRILVSHGLKYLSETRRVGLRQLMRVAKIRSSRLRAEHIAFQLAPRLNAAGRLGCAKEAFDLLMATDPDEAERLASRLDRLSQERRELENEVIDEAKRQVEEQRLFDDPIIFVAKEKWHRGVVGIVASRLVEEMGKPAFVVGVEADEGIGSVRGRGQISVYDGLLAASAHLKRFGGHRDAAGFTVDVRQMGALKEALIEYANANTVPVADEGLLCDAGLTAADIHSGLLEELNLIGPFGPGNPEPVFDIDGLYVLSHRPVGQDHLKLELKTPTARVAAFGPRMASVASTLPPLIRVAATVCPDEWRGNGFLELRLQAPPVPGS